MVKKAQTTTSETPVGPELTTAATLGTEFKMSNDTVVKCLRDAGVAIVSTMVSGKRNFAFYDKAKATEAIKRKIAEKERIARERLEAKEALQKRREEKAGAAGATSDKAFVGVPVLDPNFNVAAIAEAVKLAVAKNFDVLAQAIEHQSSALAVAVSKRETQDVSQFTLLHEQLAKMTERIDSLTQVVASLENTLLAIHTAPAVPALEPTPTPAPSPDTVQVKNKSEGASKEQQFFREGNEAATDHQNAEVQGKKTGKVHVPSGAWKNPVRVLKGQSADDSKSQTSIDSGNGAGKSLDKPRVLVIGLLDRLTRHLVEFNSKLDIEFIDNSKANRLSSQTVPKADYVLIAIKFIGHNTVNMKFVDAEVINVVGAATKVRKVLQDICLKHNII